MRIFLCLRNTRDWNNIDINDILDESNIFNNCSTYIKNIRRWQKYITPKYFEYRQILKDIAINQWSLPWFAYCDNYIEHLNDEDIIVPVDDDDWFHPDLENFLVENSKNCDFGYWDAIVNQTVNNFNIHTWHSCHDYVCSNTYFFRVSFLRSQKSELGKKLIKDHFVALKTAKEMGLKIMDKKDSIMSVYNRHPGSYSILDYIRYENVFLSLFSKKEIPPIPDFCKWATGGINLVRDLICSLEVKDHVQKNIKFFY